jgi:hypothetical protein
LLGYDLSLFLDLTALFDKRLVADARIEYETSPERPALRQLADKHGVSRSTIFKRAAREKWKQNAALVEATRSENGGRCVPRLENCGNTGTVRRSISVEVWQQIKAAYAAGIGLREIAR